MTLTTDAPNPATAPAPPRRDRSWIALAAGVAFVVGVTFTFSYLMRASFQPSAPHAFDTAFADNFDRRSNDAGLGTTASGYAWTSVAGLWAIDAGKATVSYPDKATSIAIVGSVKYAGVLAKVSGRADCGILARYVDPQNYIALVRAFKYGVWNLVSVEHGTETVLAKLPDVKSAGVTVKLETGHRVVTAYVADQSTTVILPTTTTAAPVGFVAHGGAATACAWDDLWVYTGK